MENGLILMIVVTTLFIAATVGFAVYGSKLNKQFPKTIKAKVMRIETLESGKFRYHFEGKSNGRRIMEDIVTYKEKKWKVGDKVEVRMNTAGNKCHSDFPVWPTVLTVFFALVALITPFIFYASSVEHDHDHSEDSVIEEVVDEHDHEHEEIESETVSNLDEHDHSEEVSEDAETATEDGHEHVDAEDSNETEENVEESEETNMENSEGTNENETENGETDENIDETIEMTTTPTEADSGESENEIDNSEDET